MELILILLGLLIIGFSFEFKYKSKQLEFKEKAMELETKSILLFVYGCLYEIFIVISFKYHQVDIKQYLPYFLIAFALGKLSYKLLLNHFLKREVN